jgi:hypothetical protein
VTGFSDTHSPRIRARPRADSDPGGVVSKCLCSRLEAVIAALDAGSRNADEVEMERSASRSVPEMQCPYTLSAARQWARSRGTWSGTGRRSSAGGTRGGDAELAGSATFNPSAPPGSTPDACPASTALVTPGRTSADRSTRRGKRFVLELAPTRAIDPAIEDGGRRERRARYSDSRAGAGSGRRQRLREAAVRWGVGRPRPCQVGTVCVSTMRHWPLVRGCLPPSRP